jgi:hypothetical protein
MVAETDTEVTETETQATNADVAEPEPRPDLVWDKEALGLCVRVHGNGAQSFLFVYRLDDRSAASGLGTLRSGRWQQPETGRRSCVQSSSKAATLRVLIENGKRSGPSRASRTSSATLPSSWAGIHNPGSTATDRAVTPFGDLHASAGVYLFTRKNPAENQPLKC